MNRIRNTHVYKEAAFYKRKFFYSFFKKDSSYQCPICKWTGNNFLDYDCGYGNIYKNAECPVCKSHPRHRLTYLYLENLNLKHKTLDILHFSPEFSLEKYFSRYQKIKYLSVDIDEKLAMKKEDIQHLSFPDNTFDVILCLCVLEHVENDRQAINELFRVTKKKGFCIIDTPINYSLKKTYQDAAVITPSARAKAYWQEDHVRLYGRDFPQKLTRAGFKLHRLFATDILNKEKCHYFGLPDYPLHVVFK